MNLKKKTIFIFPKIDFDELTTSHAFANNWFGDQGSANWWTKDPNDVYKKQFHKT